MIAKSLLILLLVVCHCCQTRPSGPQAEWEFARAAFAEIHLNFALPLISYMKECRRYIAPATSANGQIYFFI